MFEDTIIAISTPPGYGGLGIIRLSGKKALSVAKKMFKPKTPGSVFLPGRTVFGYLFDPEKKEAFDEAVLTFFKAPRSYTREDVVEISSHGSPVVMEEVVRLGTRLGARHAHPGEFTLRAYRRGRLDIIQAEAVNDLIRAVSLKQAKISFKQIEGSLSRKVASIRRNVIGVLSTIEAAVEFPDEGLKLSPAHTARKLGKLISDVDELIAGYDAGRALTEGIPLAIAGKTNVGKSTLFNVLLEQERAIVTPHPGTTRDYLRERAVIGDSVFQLIDTAGLGQSSHPVEREGMRRSEKLAKEADGILLVFDASRPEGREDLRFLKIFNNKKIIMILNKIDLARKFNRSLLRSLAPDIPVVELSALKRMNIKGLKTMIRNLFVPSSEGREDRILHSRQKILLDEIAAVLKQGRSILLTGQSEEIAAEELRQILPLIGQLTGEIQIREVIEDIFQRFCVGK